MTLKELGKIAKDKRKSLKLTGKQLCIISGVAQPTISNFENGLDVGSRARDKIMAALGYTKSNITYKDKTDIITLD